MKKSFVIIFCACTNLCLAQFADSLHKAFDGKKHFIVDYDSRNSFIDNNRIGVNSFKLGVGLGEKITVGAGYAWLNNNTPIYNRHRFFDSESRKDTSLSRQLSLKYVCYYITYTYYKSKRWELSVPMQMGIGKVGYSYWYKNGIKKDDAGYCFLYEPEVNVKFTVLRWFGVEGDVGYRFLFQKSSFIKNTFNSPLFAFGVFINWNELALMTFPKNKWVQNKFGPSDW